MLKNKKFNLIILVIFLIVSFLIPKPIFAGDNLSVEFQSVPLFEKINFLPGETIQRWTRVKNHTSVQQKIAVQATNFYQCQPEEFCLSKVLRLQIFENGLELYNDFLENFFQAGEIFLSDLNGNNNQTQYDFAIIFYPESGNEFQETIVYFDLEIGFQENGQSGDENAPIILAKWEMNQNSFGQDDDSDFGAQFFPSAQFQVDKEIAVCGIATDPEGVADVYGVYAEIFYPQIKPVCGEPAGWPIELNKLNKNDGRELFCDKIRNQNNNLPMFSSDYDYERLCAQDGKLNQETAFVFCGDYNLKYDNPAGDYSVKIYAIDFRGLSSQILKNNFRYLSAVASEFDFDEIDYGSVKLKVRKLKTGDGNFGTANLPTVRNSGNTRLQILVEQDDFDLGQTDEGWNVEYGAKVEHIVPWQFYFPFQQKVLENKIDLSETQPIDFSISVRNFSEQDFYSGEMILGSQAVEFESCE